jgi:hypothetical protein
MEDPHEAGEGFWFKTGWRLIRFPQFTSGNCKPVEWVNALNSAKFSP